MGIWLDILNAAAAGDSETARRLMWEELPLALRRYERAADGAYVCHGPLAAAIAKFGSRLPSAARARVALHAEDLAEYVVETVCDQIERSIRLVELCREQPGGALDDLVAAYPWPAGLKWPEARKQIRIANMLRSMLELGVPLGDVVADAVREAGEPKFRFDEMAYALSAKRVDQSWNDFKKRNDIGAKFVSIVDDEASDGVAEEGVDFGSIAVARVVLATVRAERFEEALDLSRLAARISEELAATLDRFHGEGPSDGYRPIAWHAVFWSVRDEYHMLALDVETRDPYCEIDQALAEHLAGSYPDVKGTSRPTVYRRRSKLERACEDLILVHARGIAGERS